VSTGLAPRQKHHHDGAGCFHWVEILIQPSVLGGDAKGVSRHFISNVMKFDLITRKELYANVVVSSFQESFERMTEELTALAPSTIEVVAPPDGNIITVDAKRFHYADVFVQPSSTRHFFLSATFTAAKRSTPMSCCQQHDHPQRTSGSRELISARIVRRVVLAGGTTNFQGIGEHTAKVPTTSAPSMT